MPERFCAEAKNVLGSPSNANCRICPCAVASVVSIVAATGSVFSAFGMPEAIAQQTTIGARSIGHIERPIMISLARAQNRNVVSNSIETRGSPLGKNAVPTHLARSR